VSFDVLIGTLLGTLVGSGISVLVTYLTHRWTRKREMQRTEEEREDKAISRVFSPLVFYLHNARDVFANIMALHGAFEKMSEGAKTKEVVALLSYVTAKGTTRHPRALEKLLLHRGGLIRSPQFYVDLLVFQSYLDTIVTFVTRLILRSEKSLVELKRYLSALAPLITQLDEAIGRMREYSMARTMKAPRHEYVQFFTEEKYSELEGYLNDANKILTGEDILEWPLLLKLLHRDSDDKKRNSLK